nr:carboxypeptidase M32 [uncultured Cetobacterium sp.]
MEKELLLFREKIKEKKKVDSMMALLQWDLETQSPKGGYKLIAEMIGDLSLRSYNLTTSKEFIDLVENLEKRKDDLGEIEKREVELLVEEIDKIKVIPAEEYKAYSELTAKAQGVWAEAREKKDFSIFKPFLEQIFEYTKKFLEYRGEKKDLYSILLNDYEKGMDVKKLDKFFEELKIEIVPLLKEIEKVKKESKKIEFEKRVEEQEKLNREILKYIGFDFTKGVLSQSEHPFTLTVSKDDVRLTTRYFENDPLSAIYSTLHEGGHGIYEQGIGDELAETILADGASMGIHESQSRFYENIIGRSREFIVAIKETLIKHFPELEEIENEEFYKYINNVESSLIRVEADELTYSLHIMIRYEIEKGLINGKLNVEDLPKIWNEKMKEYLGVEPKDDSEGVLQDVHWSCGLIGYFPSYALGNVYSLQILNQLKKEIEIEKVIKSGEILKIKEWLREKIHKYGKLKTAKELLMDVTGEELNSKYYIEYLANKYKGIYNIEQKNK